MEYVRVVGTKIVEGPRSLPTVWENVSNFHVLPNESLVEYGWYPYRFVKHADYGNPDKVLAASTIEFLETEVVEYQNMTDKTDAYRQSEIDSAMSAIRMDRNRKLQMCDWTQIPDCTIPNKSEWAIYRQALRDLPDNIQNPFEDVVWPTPPSE